MRARLQRQAQTGAPTYLPTRWAGGLRIPGGFEPHRRWNGDHPVMICALTGEPHRLFWMRSAWWCSDCRQKIESCCEGGGCPSIVEAETQP